MGIAGRIAYFGALACLALIAVTSAVAAVSAWTLAALVLAVVFGFSAPYVLGRRWRPAQPEPRARPVTRGRR